MSEMLFNITIRIIELAYATLFAFVIERRTLL